MWKKKQKPPKRWCFFLDFPPASDVNGRNLEVKVCCFHFPSSYQKLQRNVQCVSIDGKVHLLQEVQYLIICKCCDMAKWMAQKNKQKVFFLEEMKKPHSHRNHRRMGIFVEPSILCMSRYAFLPRGGHGYHLFLSDSRNVGNTMYVDTIVTGTDVTEEQEFCWNFSQQKPSCQADLHYRSCWSNKNSWIMDDLSLFHPKGPCFSVIVFP